MRYESCECPVCGEETSAQESERFDMCLDCFTDSVISCCGEDILCEFLRENRRTLRGYIWDNYE